MNDQQPAITELLARTDLFAGLQPAHLEAIAKVTKLVEFEARTTVVRQGEGGSELYILARGSVAVVREDPALGIEHVVGTLRAPEFFGEMSLLSQSRRAATIRTLEETACVVLAAASYVSLLEKIPAVAVQISRYLSRRLDHQMAIMGFRFIQQEELVYDPELYRTFSEGLLRKHKAIPLRLDGSTLTVAMTRPHDLAAVSALRQELPGLGLQPVACAVEDYEAFVQRHLQTIVTPLPSPARGELTLENGRPLPAPLARLLSHAAVEGRLIIETSNQDLSLLLTTAQGSLEPLDLELEDWERKALQQQLQEMLDQDGGDLCRRTVLADGQRGEMRLSRLQTLRGPRYSIVLSDPRGSVPMPSFLWPTEVLRATVEQAVCGSGGAVLVTGANRSGRSTTLYSMLRMLEREGVRPNVITLESEPLLTLGGVAQVRVEADLAGRCPSEELARVMKVTMAQGPDVLLVDEPQVEDLGQLLEVAEDGLTLLTTIKGGDPLSTLGGLSERHDLRLSHAENLKLLVGQQLLRRICGECRTEYSPSPAVLSQLEKSGLGTRTDRYYRGTGCAQCRGQGSYGRIANFEIVKLDPFLSDMLVNARPAEAMRKAAIAHNLLFSFKSFARLLVLQGQVLPTEALRLYGGP